MYESRAPREELDHLGPAVHLRNPPSFPSHTAKKVKTAPDYADFGVGVPDDL